MFECDKYTEVENIPFLILLSAYESWIVNLYFVDAWLYMLDYDLFANIYIGFH